MPSQRRSNEYCEGMIKTAKPGPKVVAAIVALLVLLLTFFGVLDGIPSWIKGILQFFGTAGGIVLGYLLQAGDTKIRDEAKAKSARGQVIALAETVSFAVDFIAERRLDLSIHTTVATLRASADAGFSGVETSLRGVLRQASVAAENWDHGVPVPHQQIPQSTGTKTSPVAHQPDEA